MKKFLTTCATVAALTFSAGAASASFIDFTDASAYGVGITQTSNTTLVGAAAGGWSGVTVGGSINLREAGPGAIGPLAGDNDGLGILDDEISFPLESFTMTFNNAVTIVGLFFLDHFSPEEVIVTVDGLTTFSFASTVVSGRVGFTEFADLNLTGTSFVFTASQLNEIGNPDFALAGIDLAPIPLPAGLLLLGGALGALGVSRRRKAA